METLANNDAIMIMLRIILSARKDFLLEEW